MVGDVNSTVACALTATKLNIPVAHVEAGLRSFDKTMPEEINRLLTDQLSDLLFTTCEDANNNLLKEGIEKDKIFFVGNVMIDSLLNYLELAKKTDILSSFGLISKNSENPEELLKYAVLTLHRPANVDNPEKLKNILEAIREISKEICVVFPVHPRTASRINEFKFNKLLPILPSVEELQIRNNGIVAIHPIGYLEFLNLMAHASLVLTDSGGIQEETTVLGVPCLTLRENTERPITITEGTNELIGTDKSKIIERTFEILRNGGKKGRIPKYWDGKASKRIVRVIGNIFK